MINQSKVEVPEFNAFEKIEDERPKRISLAKRLLPYAAMFLLVVSSIFIYQNFNSNNTELTLSEAELAELQKNTNIALLHFSKELKACMAKFEDAKEMKQPADEMKQLKDFKIQSENPLKNINFN